MWVDSIARCSTKCLLRHAKVLRRLVAQCRDVLYGMTTTESWGSQEMSKCHWLDTDAGIRLKLSDHKLNIAWFANDAWHSV